VPLALPPAQIVVHAPVRRSRGLASGAWAARAVTGPLAAAALSWPLVAARTTLDPKPALATCAAAGAWLAIANARRGRTRRLHARRMARWHLGRGELRERYPIDGVLDGPAAVFRLGVTTDPGPRGDHELQWRPWDGDPPHVLLAGSTGSGKTEAGRLILASALSWGWDVEVIDLKGSTEYHPLPVHETTAAARDCLARVMAEIRRRGELLRDVRREVIGPDGHLYDGRPRNFRDVPEDERAGLRTRLVLIDEAALLRLPGSADEKARKAGENAVRFLQAATALARSLGIHIAILVQRPDADLLPGFLRNNVQARMLFGANDEEAQRMTIGPAVATQAVVDSDVTARPPGRCLAADVGGPGARLAHGYLLHEAALLRALDAAGPDSPPAGADGDVGPSVDGAPDAPAPSAARPVGPAGARHLRVVSDRRGVGIFDSPPGDLASSSAPPPSVPPSRASSSARTPRGPIARAVLRAAAWRLLVGPLVPDPPPRPSGLRAEVMARRPERCGACGARGVALEVEHRRPRWAGGSDRPRNLWLACRRCHAAKTSEEALVRAWRRRLAPRTLRALVPAWAWAPAVAVALGVYGLGGLLGLALAALATWQAWSVLVDPRGLDGLNSLDARLEAAYGGPIAAASRARTTAVATTRAARLLVGALGASYLVGAATAWWW
jgi:hypothetical protein